MSQFTGQDQAFFQQRCRLEKIVATYGLYAQILQESAHVFSILHLVSQGQRFLRELLCTLILSMTIGNFTEISLSLGSGVCFHEAL